MASDACTLGVDVAETPWAPSTRRVAANATATLAIAGVLAVGLAVDDAIVTEVEAQETALWLPVGQTGELVSIDASQGTATGRVSVAEEDVVMTMIDSGARLGVVELGSGTFTTVDAALGTVRNSLPTGATNVEAIVESDDGAHLWVLGNSVASYFPGDSETPLSTALPGEVSSAAYNGAGAAVAVIDDQPYLFAGADDPTAIGEPIPGLVVVGFANGVAYVRPGDGRVEHDDGTVACTEALEDDVVNWAPSVRGRRIVAGTNNAAGTVHVSQLRSGECSTIRLTDGPGEFGAPFIFDERLYVADATDGVIHIVNLDTNRVLSTPVFRSGEPVDFLLHNDEVIAHEPRTFLGAVLSPIGVDRFIDKSPSRQLSTVFTEGGVPVLGPSGGPREDADSELVAPSDPSVLGAGEDADLDTAVPQDDVLIANFAFSASRVQVDTIVVFIDESSGGPRSWSWDFGDNTVASGQRVEKAWSRPGTYVVTLIVDRPGETATRSALIEVVAAETLIPPQADFIFSESTVEIGEQIEFRDVSEGEVDSRRWDFGDGSSSAEEGPSKSWEVPGNYVVTLTVTNAAGADSASADITVVETLIPPKAVIEIDKTTVEVGEPVAVRSISTGDVSNVMWHFGDGEVSSSDVTSHVYAGVGTYVIELTVSNAAGTSSEKVEVFVLAATVAPVARIAALPSIIEVGVPVQFLSQSLNNPVTLDWEFGDGGTASGPVVTHAFASAGSFVTSLTAANAKGSGIDAVAVTVIPYLPPPSAGFSSPSSIRVGEPVVLTDLSTNVTDYLWSYGDGATSVTGGNQIHTYTTDGSYIVTLDVGNRNGTDQWTAPLEVLPALPTANFTASPNPARVGDVVTFTNLSENAVGYEWDFNGDLIIDSFSTAPSLQFSYVAPGNKTASLLARNASGETDTYTVEIVVDPPPPVLSQLTANPSPGVTLDTVEFQAVPAVGSGPITSYLFDFGDGTQASVSPGFEGIGTVTHTYAVADVYSVSVFAQGFRPEDSDSLAISLTVTDPAAPDVSISSIVPASPEVTESTLLTAVANPGSGPILSWMWNMGDGTTLFGQSVSHAWATTGLKTVTLTASGPFLTDVQVAFVDVVLPPAPLITSATATPSSVLTGELVQFAATATGQVATWEWDFDYDGITFTVDSSSQNPIHTYGVADVYNARLRVTGPFGQTDEQSVIVTVGAPAPIIVSPTFSPPEPDPLELISFFVGQDVGSGPITLWEWDFDYTGIFTVDSTAQNPTHFYAVAGVYTAAARATGPGGTDLETVLVFVDRPILNPPTYLPSQAYTGEVVNFFVTVAPGSGAINTWSWDFGDGIGTSTVQNPTYTYTSSGVYLATVTATGPGGTSIPVQVPVSVLNPISANFTFTQPGGAGTPVFFTDTSTGAPAVSWLWTFGDGSPPSTSQNPAHSYGAPGPYTVTLQVTDAGPHVDSIPILINVQ